MPDEGNPNLDRRAGPHKPGQSIEGPNPAKGKSRPETLAPGAVLTQPPPARQIAGHGQQERNNPGAVRPAAKH